MDWKRTFQWLFIDWVLCLIHNGIPKSFVWRCMNYMFLQIVNSNKLIN